MEQPKRHRSISAIILSILLILAVGTSAALAFLYINKDDNTKCELKDTENFGACNLYSYYKEALEMNTIDSTTGRPYDGEWIMNVIDKLGKNTSIGGQIIQKGDEIGYTATFQEDLKNNKTKLIYTECYEPDTAYQTTNKCGTDTQIGNTIYTKPYSGNVTTKNVIETGDVPIPPISVYSLIRTILGDNLGTDITKEYWVISSVVNGEDTNNNVDTYTFSFIKKSECTQQTAEPVSELISKVRADNPYMLVVNSMHVQLDTKTDALKYVYLVDKAGTTYKIKITETNKTYNIQAPK